VSELNRLSISDAGSLIEKREISPVELTQACLHAIEEVDATLSSFLTITAEHALDAAKAAEQEIGHGRYTGRLHGIPYALKDVYETAGIRTTGHSRLLADNIPERDCDAQERLKAAGAILLGKTATFEFAHGGAAWDTLAPPARNPWDIDCSPSGSSSGSAVAVAARLCPAALGTDTGGSIRLPAAACGVVGLKPTYGLLSRRGILPNSFSQDHAGPITTNVRDAAILLQALAGHDRKDPSSLDVEIPGYVEALSNPVKGLRVGVPYRWFEQDKPASAALRQAFDAAISCLVDLGLNVCEIDLPPLVNFEDVKRVIALAELYSIHEKTLKTQPQMLGQGLRSRVRGGIFLTANDYIKALRFRTELAQSVQSAFARCDLLALPTSEPAARLEPRPPGEFFSQLGWTSAFNLSGNPALTLCSGYSANGLPLSLQLVGRLCDESTLLCVGHAYEQATQWNTRLPEIISGGN